MGGAAGKLAGRAGEELTAHAVPGVAERAAEVETRSMSHTGAAAVRTVEKAPVVNKISASSGHSLMKSGPTAGQITATGAVVAGVAYGPKLVEGASNKIDNVGHALYDGAGAVLHAVEHGGDAALKAVSTPINNLTGGVGGFLTGTGGGILATGVVAVGGYYAYSRLRK